MRKLLKSVIPFGAVIWIMATACVCFGQTTVEGYVLRDDALVRQNATTTVNSFLKDEDELTRTPYVEAVVKAFDRYWSKGKVKFDWKSYDKAKSEVNEIQAKISQCDSLQRLLNKDLAKSRKVIKETDNAVVSDAEVMEYLRSRIAQLHQSSDSLAAQIESAQQTLDQKKDSLSQRNNQLNLEASAGGQLSEAYAAADSLTEIISRLKDTISKDIVAVNTADIDRASEMYEKYIDMIGTFSPQKYTIIVEGLGEITPYRPLTEALNRAIISMASIGTNFDAVSTKKLAFEIESLIKTGKALTGAEKFDTKLLSVTQRSQCKEVVNALMEQERSAKNLTYLLDYIVKQNPKGIKAGSYDVAADVAKIVNLVNPSQNRYDSRYQNFNNILQVLETELVATDFTIEELEKYIQQKKTQI